MFKRVYMHINKLWQLTSFVGSIEGGFDGEDVGSTPVIKLRQKLPSPVENIRIDMSTRANNV